MYRLSTRLALVLVCCLGLALPAAAQDAPQVGSCALGTARRDIDANDVRASLFNTGSLYFGTASDAAQYIVPASSGNSPIYATGIWIGGTVGGEIRVAGATYADFEFWPGPLDSNTGRPVNPTDCEQFDRIYKVSRTDIATFESTGLAATDLAEWPVALGAPTIAAPDNGFNDDGDLDADGNPLIDEGTDGISNDDDNGDGFICSGIPTDPAECATLQPDAIDERDEQERVVVSIRQEAGLPLYNLGAGDRPDIIGDQGLWWVMNDVGAAHSNSSTPPVGVEVQVLAWAFARADALGQATFYRYRVINKQDFNIENTYLAIFSDPDLGYSDDDLMGIDTTLSLGYVYNGDDNDEGFYGTQPPAAGYDFFQGPIVDGDTLGATVFSYFIRGAAAPLADPANGVEIYNFMRGRWSDGTPYTVGGDGYQETGPETVFAFPGDPVTGQFWSEENINGSGGRNTPGDRRFVVSTGPFTLVPDTPQDIVFGLVFGSGSNRLASISALRAADRTAQAAYDADFELAAPAPPPPPCDPDSPNPELRPGSGRCAEVIESDGQATLIWGYPSNQNIFAFRELDRLVTDPTLDPFYEFEGFNVYRYPDARFRQEDRELVATYDRVTPPGQVIDVRQDPATGQPQFFIAARGTNSGVQFTYNIPNLTNYQDVYYGITAYTYNESSIPKVIESSATLLTARPSRVTAGAGGSVSPSEFGTLIPGQIQSGRSGAPLFVRVVDPTSVIAATYRVEFFDIATGDSTTTSYRIFRNGESVYDGAQILASTDSLFIPGGVVGPFDNVPSNNIIIDGLEFFVASTEGIARPAVDDGAAPGISGGGRGVLETSYPGFSNTCPDPSNPDDYGCVNYGNVGNAVIATATALVPEGNVNEDYFVSTVDRNLAALTVNGVVPAGDQFEIRFTEAGGIAVGRTAIGAQATNPIFRVPFEVWNVGQRPNDASDDVRMIPRIFGAPAGVSDLTNYFLPTTSTANVLTFGETTYARTPVISAYMPDRPNGYELFEQAALGFGGPGATYTRANDGDTQVDLSGVTGTQCGPSSGSLQGYYTDFCYRDELVGAAAGGAGNFPIGNIVFGDLARDGTTPPAGTVVRILSTPPGTSAQPGDVYEFNTTDFAFRRGDQATAEEALDLIGIVPNPYFGASRYETGNLERIARFINMPDVVNIRIYTVSGSLIRTINKTGPSRSVDWDLTTESGLPVASGMYLIHVDVPGVGDRVLKFGVINRTTDVNIF